MERNRRGIGDAFLRDIGVRLAVLRLWLISDVQAYFRGLSLW